MTTEAQPDYLAYLLRLWRVNDAGKPVWRASLESPHSGEQRVFPSPEAAFDFLRTQMGLAPADPTTPVESTEEVKNKT
jgi:hypothetical protein